MKPASDAVSAVNAMSLVISPRRRTFGRMTFHHVASEKQWNLIKRPGLDSILFRSQSQAVMESHQTNLLLS